MFLLSKNPLGAELASASIFGLAEPYGSKAWLITGFERVLDPSAGIFSL